MFPTCSAFPRARLYTDLHGFQIMFCFSPAHVSNMFRLSSCQTLYRSSWVSNHVLLFTCPCFQHVPPFLVPDFIQIFMGFKSCSAFHLPMFPTCSAFPRARLYTDLHGFQIMFCFSPAHVSNMFRLSSCQTLYRSSWV